MMVRETSYKKNVSRTMRYRIMRGLHDELPEGHKAEEYRARARMGVMHVRYDLWSPWS